MGYERIVRDEIDAVLDDCRRNRRNWDAGWITKAVCDRHEAALSSDEDGEFWRYAGYGYVRDQVRKRVNSLAGDQKSRDDRQIILPGYEHLQAYYMVHRRNKDVGVPLERMTDAEISEKIKTYTVMSAACLAHADELRTWQDNRRSDRRRA